MIPRRITFFGNCQAETLARLYREFCADDETDDVAWVDVVSLDEANPERDVALARLAQTTLLAEQIFDWPRKLDDHLPPGCQRVAFPNATLWFLWPYSGVPHPRNDELGGYRPYPAEFGDAYLNRQLRAGVPAAQAVQNYLGLDIVQHARLASRFDKEMELLDKRDAACGTGLRAVTEAHFRTEKLFSTRGHPNLRILRLLGLSVFRRMGAAEDRAAAALDSLRQTPFRATELPIHPGIAAHFGLSYAGPATTYRSFREGRFTFADYAERYMNFTVNRPLARLLEKRSLPPEQRLPIIDEALVLAPGSAFLLTQRAETLFVLGQVPASLAAARAACDADLADPVPWFAFATLLLRAGNEELAGYAAQRVLSCHPHHAGAHKLLGRLQATRPAERLKHLRAAVTYAPRDAEARALLATAR